MPGEFRARIVVAGVAIAAMLSIAFAPPTSGVGLTWRVEILDDTGGAGHHSSLAIAANGTTYVLYQDDGGGTLRLGTFYAGAWSFEQVAGRGYFVGDTSLVLDFSGDLHISYFDGVADIVRYGTRPAAGGPWNLTDVDFGYVDGYNRLALDRFGGPAIAYSMNNGSLRFARLSGSTWFTEYVDTSTIVARYESLVLDSGGRPHIAYYGNGQLRYASKPGLTWTIEVVDPRDYVGWFSQVGMDSRGRPEIAYYDSTEHSLRYATESLTGRWTLSVIDDVGDPGLGISLFVGRDDQPRVAYYARIASELRYGELVNGSWETQSVDDEDVVGWEPSLALDSAGTPHVSYYDWTRDALRYAVGLPILGARTIAAASVQTASAILRGQVTSLDGYAAANVSFNWRPLGDPVWRNTSRTSLSAAGPFEVAIGGLTSGETYEFQAIVEAGGKTEMGRILTFTTRVPAASDPLLVVLASIGTGVAIVGFSLAAYTWIRGPISFRKRDGTRRDGQA